MDGAEFIVTDLQFAALVELLTDIRDGILVLVAQPDESTECQHPEEQRISFSTMGDPNHWVCRVCRWDNKEHAKPMN